MKHEYSILGKLSVSDTTMSKHVSDSQLYISPPPFLNFRQLEHVEENFKRECPARFSIISQKRKRNKIYW